MIHIWRIDLDRAAPSAPTPEEAARAARFAREELARRYLASHAALRALLARFTAAPLEFAAGEKGKPWLRSAPEVRFNLSHSAGRALVAISRECEVGVDLERIRPIACMEELVERYFPPGEPVPADERGFYRRWTRLEALWKAEGEWSEAEVDAGEGFAGAVVWEGGPRELRVCDYESDEGACE